jgi:hypothetical protein
MSATITTNWLESFKTNLSCGHFPSKTSNPYMEMLTGLVGIEIERLLVDVPDALDIEASANIEGQDSLLMWYNKIKCGEFFESDAQAWSVLAMVRNKQLANETTLATEASAEELDLVDNHTANYVLVADDFDNPLGEPKTLVVTSGTAKTVDVPANATLALPIGSKLKIIQGGAGTVTFDALGADTVVGTFATTAQWEALLIEKIAATQWHSVLVA